MIDVHACPLPISLVIKKIKTSGVLFASMLATVYYYWDLISKPRLSGLLLYYSYIYIFTKGIRVPAWVEI